MKHVVSVVINCDNRYGYKNNSSIVGEFGEGSLQGVRSTDLLTEGIRNKINFFRGYEIQCILYVDQHSEIEPELMREMKSIVEPCGNNSMVVVKSHDRVKYRWYDYITIEALKLATGDYVVHFDQDSNAFRTDDCDIIDRYIAWLEGDYKYICQPWDGIGDPMFWASTRFFICKRGTLDIPFLEYNLYTPFMGKHTPCLEHMLGALAGDGNVLYPPREDDKYIIFSWVKYYGGTLKKLNDMPPAEALKYIFDLGVCGPNDVIDKQ